ncbi:hypothetical protein RFI_23337 [Reticulomyxa filosa]|uniref:Uncharacterized protein n=1 Tax=Reticulomyxa filosa TaxID=46433 RepID=X6MJK7_RETFI|nr:hypothetical protein RFI_23337 [Reticulomyxa filosa]|eukprot:ETO14034.1 hypothetical protein RFI_23337 [Reticulomyxa filosa]
MSQTTKNFLPTRKSAGKKPFSQTRNFCSVIKKDYPIKMSLKRATQKEDNIVDVSQDMKEANRILISVARFRDAGPFQKIDALGDLREDYEKCNPNPIFIGLPKCLINFFLLSKKKLKINLFKKTENISKKLENKEYANILEMDEDFRKIWAQEDKLFGWKDRLKLKDRLTKRHRQAAAIRNYYEILISPMMKLDSDPKQPIKQPTKKDSLKEANTKTNDLSSFIPETLSTQSKVVHFDPFFFFFYITHRHIHITFFFFFFMYITARKCKCKTFISFNEFMHTYM